MNRPRSGNPVFVVSLARARWLMADDALDGKLGGTGLRIETLADLTARANAAGFPTVSTWIDHLERQDKVARCQRALEPYRLGRAYREVALDEAQGFARYVCHRYCQILRVDWAVADPELVWATWDAHLREDAGKGNPGGVVERLPEPTVVTIR